MFSQLDRIDPTPDEYEIPMSKRLPIDPLYSAQPQTPSRDERRRLQRYTRPFVNRSTPWPIDQFTNEQRKRRDKFLRELKIGIVLGIMAAYPPSYLVLALTGHVR